MDDEIIGVSPQDSSGGGKGAGTADTFRYIMCLCEEPVPVGTFLLQRGAPCSDAISFVCLS